MTTTSERPAAAQKARGRRPRGRPALYTSYAQDMALLNTRGKKVAVLGLLAVGLLLPMLVEDDLLRRLAVGCVLAIGAIGLNLVTGYAGQVSLGHAFFLGVGAYTASVVAGDPADDDVYGFGITFVPVWLLAAGAVAAVLGLLVAFALVGRNIARSAVGRSFAAVRDRDIAAAITGVDVARVKRRAFVVSSFYAGCAGALLYSIEGYIDPASFGLLVSVQFVAMILIGGVSTISGSIMGAFFIALLPVITRELPEFLPFLSASATETPNVFQVETLLYGLLIVIFLIFEPRGLFGLWVRARNYWKAWPFSY